MSIGYEEGGFLLSVYSSNRKEIDSMRANELSLPVLIGCTAAMETKKSYIR